MCTLCALVSFRSQKPRSKLKLLTVSRKSEDHVTKHDLQSAEAHIQIYFQLLARFTAQETAPPPSISLIYGDALFLDWTTWAVRLQTD
jgi:hypothetical protein